MALCCIGGVCVPYSALLPLIAYGIKYLLEKLVQWGILPKSWQEKISALLHHTPSPANNNQKTSRTSKLRKQSSLESKTTCGACCTSASSSSSLTTDDATVRLVESAEEWDDLFHNNTNVKVVCKWTASWCQPCKTIQPFYESLASQFKSTRFVTADVDDLDEIAGQYQVAMLPTFCVFYKKQQDGEVVLVDRYSGSNEAKLQEFLEQHLEKQ